MVLRTSYTITLQRFLANITTGACNLLWVDLTSQDNYYTVVKSMWNSFFMVLKMQCLYYKHFGL